MVICVKCVPAVGTQSKGMELDVVGFPTTDAQTKTQKTSTYFPGQQKVKGNPRRRNQIYKKILRSARMQHTWGRASCVVWSVTWSLGTKKKSKTAVAGRKQGDRQMEKFLYIPKIHRSKYDINRAIINPLHNRVPLERYLCQKRSCNRALQ